MEDLREEYLDLGLIPVKEETDPVYERYRLTARLSRLASGIMNLTIKEFSVLLHKDLYLRQ